MADRFLDSPYGLAPTAPAPGTPAYAPQPIPEPTIATTVAPFSPAVQGAPRPGSPATRRMSAEVIPFRPPMGRVMAGDGSKPMVEATAQQLADLIKRHESHGDYTALNPSSTASGAYQYINSTWANYGGYPRAALAPPAVQDERALIDVTKALDRYGADPYKVIAAHYLPAEADEPESWGTPYKINGHTVPSVASYVRSVVRGTPLESSFDEYLESQAKQG